MSKKGSLITITIDTIVVKFAWGKYRVALYMEKEPTGSYKGILIQHIPTVQFEFELQKYSVKILQVTIDWAMKYPSLRKHNKA